MNKKKSLVLFQYSYWDLIPVIAGFMHFAYLIFILLSFHHIPLWQSVLLGLIYAFSISWNINGISHNFIHNAYFKSYFLNRIFSLVESITMCFSQTMYDYVHRQHHIGNNDYLNEYGDTIDWISIYRHGKHGRPEQPLKYSFLSFFRDDPIKIYRLIQKHSKSLAYISIIELGLSLLFIVGLFLYDGWLALYFLIFYYLGHSLTAMNGYYEHYKANPLKPIAWGVSCYNSVFNFIWFNNGYHAEHHYRPKQHWTKMKELHEQIKDEQKKAGVHVIYWSHALGFLQK